MQKPNVNKSKEQVRRDNAIFRKWPSYTKLAKKVGISRGAVKRWSYGPGHKHFMSSPKLDRAVFGESKAA